MAPLVRSFSRFLEPAAAVAATNTKDVAIVDSRPMGGALALDQLWHQLGIDPMPGASVGRDTAGTQSGAVVLALVANRERALVPGLAEVDEDSCYAVIRIPQVMFGMAVSEEGIPSRVRSCPGGT
ncbi:MAG TPA: hypothetical protein VNF75_06760, partial [Candidatus Dormibacteraeota bacterium]|nr:hypothetical protein [Candidatus Dormibacteraeota bacterium]